MIFLLSFLLWLYSLQISSAAVWPQPVIFQTGSQVLWFSKDFSVSYQFSSDSKSRRDVFPAFEAYLAPSRYSDLTASRSNNHHRRQALFNGSAVPHDILDVAVENMKTNLVYNSLVPYRFYPKNATFEPAADGKKTFINDLIFLMAENGNFTSNQTADNASVDECYTIDVTIQGDVIISINTQIGGVRALDTFTQLFYAHSNSNVGVYTPLAPVRIEDCPAFAHRGINLDISRNYMDPAAVMRVIRAMSFSKLNRLHLHAADAQSWPLEIPALPELAVKGAYAPNLVWSVDTLKQVQSFGYYHGVQVYLEIDTPGHTAAVAYAYPDLVAAFNEQPWANYSAEPPTGQLKLNSPAVTKFITTLLDDLLPRVSPFTSFFHTGGDEINANVYALDETVGSASPQTIQPFLQAFVSHAHDLVRSHGLTPIVWEENLAPWNLTLKPDTIIQTWIGQASLDAVIASGHRALFGDYNHWYLDCGYGQWLDPNPANPQTPIAPPYTDYCSPMKNWREVYSYDPVANYTAEEKKLIVGGEVHMWGELNDPTSLDSKLWPRAAAAAEVLWSGPTGVKGVNESVTRRLAEMRERLVLRGVMANMVQMTWCLQNEGDCSL